MYCAIAIWGTVLFWVAVFAAFWRFSYAPPHGAWAALSIITVTSVTFATLLFAVRQLRQDPQRLLWMLGICTLGTAPVFGAAMYVADVSIRDRHGRALPYTSPLCVTAYWLASVADIEARWSYPRWTSGRQVVLIDDGSTPKPNELVAKMDEHVDAMVRQLGARLPDGKLRWVRGSLLGRGGNAFLTWAVCGAGDANDLTGTDRHEIAHTTITALSGPDQKPPTMLVEGWAQAWSGDRKAQICDLADQFERGIYFTLDELVSPEFYSRTTGESYNNGAPFVHYLVERYGGPNFLRLYSGVRPESFRQDFENILGDNWTVAEKNFWEWLVANASRLRNESDKPTPRVELAKGVRPDEWQAICDGYRTAHLMRNEQVDRFALALETNTEVRNDRNEFVREQQWFQACVVNVDKAWTVEKTGQALYCVANGDFVASFFVNPDGSVLEDTTNARKILNETRLFWRIVLHLNDPLYHVIANDAQSEAERVRIDGITAPTLDPSLWTIEYTSKIGTKECKGRMLINGSNWQVQQQNLIYSDGTRTDAHVTWGQLCRRPFPIEMVRHTIDTHSEQHVSKRRIRELTGAESRSLCAEIESNIVKAHRISRRLWFLNPVTFAIIWPVVGLLLCGASKAYRHSK